MYVVYIHAEKIGVVLSFADNSSLVPMVLQSSSEMGVVVFRRFRLSKTGRKIA